MKKYIAFLLCLIMILSLFSCNGNNINEKENDHTNNDTTDEITSDNPSQENVVDYSKILNMYRSIIEILPNYVDSKEAMNDYCAELGIVNEEEKELFKKLFWSTFDFKKSPPYRLSCGYATKDLNGDGMDELVLLNNEYYIMAIFSYADGNPILLGNYWPRNSCWIDGDGLLHENGSGGAAYSTNAVYKIADGGKELELIAEFGTDGVEWIGDTAYTIYYKLVDGEKKTITEAEYNALNEQYGKYLGSIAGSEATKEYSGLTFTSLYTEAEIAMEMYEAAINNEIKVYETNIQEYNYLADCKTPYNRIPLADCERLKYAYTDMDNDSINELVIDCGDTLLLRYYEGTVYVYSFTFRNLYYLNTDGSYSWNHTGQDFEYGEKQIYFEGAELKAKELYRIVNDGEPNAEYYVEGKPVTQKELQKYIEDNPKTQLVFLPLEVSWQNKISQSEAIELAEKYWESFDIKENEYLVAIGYNQRAPLSVHVVIIRWYVIDHYSTFDEIWIDKNTGEAIIPYWSDGKG